ncbi:MAG: endonuclease/exonuclease/phosphatase family protein [bacterium]|nr:endonuclease/exonuclease/phosphatase family protein [bacterium]
MKLISLNLLRGEMREPLAEFLKRYANETDIFLFQEMPGPTSKNSMPFLTSAEIEDILSGFNNYSKNYSRNEGHLEDMGFFIKKEIGVKESGEVEIHDSSIFDETVEHLWRDLNYVVLDDGQLIVNFHGLWDGPDKLDRPRRLEQSRKVKAFMDKYDGPTILAGDFNLWPGTESLKILENGMINLIDKYGIHSTRPSSFNFPNKYSDYIFVSSGIKINDFKTLPDEVSDHLALYLDINFLN